MCAGDGVSVYYEWIETCNRDGGSPPCFGSARLNTTTIGTSRLQPYENGTYKCRSFVDGLMVFSGPFTVRVTGKFAIKTDDIPYPKPILSQIVMNSCFILGAVLETGKDKNAMDIGNYTFFYHDEVPAVIYCKSGLVLSPNNTSSLGGWFFNDQPIGNDPVNCPASTNFAAETPSSSNPGLLPLLQCSDFQFQIESEGIYTCRIMDIDLQLHVFQVGFYFRRGCKFPVWCIITNFSILVYVTGFAKRYLFHTFDIPANKMSYLLTPCTD